MARVRGKARRAKARMERMVGRLPNHPASQARSTDRPSSLQASQMKSMGHLIRRLASQERITVTAGNMVADTDMAMIGGAVQVKIRASS
jgi:hypothetical protein